MMSELSARQNAVLNALRAKMDENKQVEAKAAVLAKAAEIPLGSLHSVLGSLEKKQPYRQHASRISKSACGVSGSLDSHFPQSPPGSREQTGRIRREMPRSPSIALWRS